MEKKIGVYTCTGCKIGESIDIEKLKNIATSEYRVPICRDHSFLCSQEGINIIKDDIQKEGINSVVIAGCSIRANQEIFTFDSVVVERVNIREQVAWSQEPNTEDTQMIAEDYLRMGIIKAQKMELPSPYTEDFVKTILVVGGGITGMTAALEASEAGYEVVLVEKEPQLGGFLRKLYRQLPLEPPYSEIKETKIEEIIKQIESNQNIKVFTSSQILKTAGQPGMFEVTISQNGNENTIKVGSIVLATGFKPYDATKLEHLGFGKYPNVITNVLMEEIASKGKILRPSDNKEVKRVAFIQCAGSRDENHLPYCSAFCCLTSLKQAFYLRNQDQESIAYIFYKDMRTPGQYENFYSQIQQDKGIFLTKGDVASVEETKDQNLLLTVENTLIGETIQVEVDLVILAVGIVPTTSIPAPEPEETLEQKAQEETPPEEGEEEEKPPQDVIIRSNILNLAYRQGPELPALKYGFPDSHFICFPYETRRTGIYAAGCVRAPMFISNCIQDAQGAALKAIQCVELTSRGEAVHPRPLDMTYPDLFMQRCTQCKRCTEECPFGTYNEDEKFNPLPNPTRCRRCGVCLGACPERIISFSNYSIDIIASMIKAIEVPEEDEEKPRILVFVCENDAYPAMDLVGIRRLRYNPNFRILPLRCIGSINLVWIADALSKGFDGVLLLGCKHGDDYQCHFVKGSELANYRLGKVQETLDRLALESDRIQFHQLSIDEYERIPRIFEEFMEVIDRVGPNPFKGF
jgi:quinone-modifying oxidoreductase subunit QmoB